MAKEKTKADKADAKTEKAAEREFKFGVEDIAEALDIKPASVRVQLRNRGIDKAGKSYGWATKAELKEVIDQLKTPAEPKKETKKEKPAKEDKTKGKKPAGKSKKPAPDADDD